MNRLDVFHRHCTRMIPILEAISRHGMLVDSAARDRLRIELERICREKLNEIHFRLPAGLRPVKKWTREPKPSKAFPVLYGVQVDVLGIKTLKSGKLREVKRWAMLLDFKPGSPPMVIALIRALKLKVPMEKGKPTTKSKRLRVLERKNDIFKFIRQWRETYKLLTNYAEWPLDPDNRIRPTFGFHPSTWRKSARDPNIHTIPKRVELAKLVRRIFVAAPGYLLVECDSSAIEAVLVGYFAGSIRYIELAKRGVHKWLAQEYAHRAVSKDEPLYDKMKRVVHLSNYVGTPNRILDEYPDDFDSLKEARELQEFYFATPAGQDVRAWQQQVMQLAHKEHQLENPWRYRHYFYDVFHSSGGQWVMGDDAKRAAADLPQSTASALQTEFLLDIGECDAELMGWICSITPDSIVCEVPEAHAEDAARRLLEVMTKPFPELGGLSIGAEARIGPNLAEMVEVKA